MAEHPTSEAQERGRLGHAAEQAVDVRPVREHHALIETAQEVFAPVRPCKGDRLRARHK